MATVNLGRIKPVFRGAYDNSTAYVIDDIVTSGNETFIAIAATQGNATSDGSKWTKLAAKGADGTDVAATLANKEISFKTNAGALDGIPIGTAGQFLKVNSGATGYEFGTISSDYVKLASVDTTNVSEVNFDNYFSADYHHYEWVGSCLVSTNDYRVDFNPRVSGSNILANCYQGANYGYEQTNNSNANMSFDGRHNQTEGGRLSWGRTDTPVVFKVQLFEAQNSSQYKTFMFDAASMDTNYVYRRAGTAVWRNNTNAYTGMRFFSPNGANFTWKITMFGFRK